MRLGDLVQFGLSFTPWLQPVISLAFNSDSRFNGLVSRENR